MSTASKAKTAGQFFHGYAEDFDSIYGGKSSPLGRWIDRVFRKSMLLRYQRSIAGCMPVEGRTVLDVGCGPGHYGVTLAREGASKVVGLDFADGMLELARKHAEDAGVLDRCEFVRASFEDYKPDVPFDFCIVMGVMDYIKEPEPFVAHAAEVTRMKAFFSFPEAGGVLAAYRKFRYKKRTPLYLYRHSELQQLFSKVVPGKFTIEKLARDFFVTVDCT